MTSWRSDDPDEDEATLAHLAELAVEYADRHGLADEDLVPLIVEAFYVGRACGARAISHLLAGKPIPVTAPDEPFAVRIGRYLAPPRQGGPIQ